LIAEYYYDPFGRRLWKDVGGVKTYFHYADEGLVGKYDGTGTEIKTYGYKPGSTWTTDPIFIKQNNQYYFYHNDHLGTPQKITVMNGAVVWSAKYTSFGEANVEVETVENNLRFPGQYYDQETGLHHNWNRFYSRINGRYLRIDPLGGGNKPGDNQYLYGFNNPLKNIDSKGLQAGSSGCCNAVLPQGAVGQVALMCFGESTRNCAHGAKEKRAITDVVYNRASKNKSYWGGSGILSVLRHPNQFLGYCNSECQKAKTPSSLNKTDCDELKECIKAAQGSAVSTLSKYDGFNQTNKPGRVKICAHYLRIEIP
jgi:RHS repeat-associated protein